MRTRWWASTSARATSRRAATSTPVLSLLQTGQPDAALAQCSQSWSAPCLLAMRAAPHGCWAVSLYKCDIVDHFGPYTSTDWLAQVNVCKRKAATNIRSAGADKTVPLSEPIRMGLDDALEYIEEDELVEVTPAAVRIRKAPAKKRTGGRG